MAMLQVKSVGNMGRPEAILLIIIIKTGYALIPNTGIDIGVFFKKKQHSYLGRIGKGRVAGSIYLGFVGQ